MNPNKEIAKNTVLLYCRTAVTMLISLYTSRVILEQLGVTDYGIYNVIGGFVAMLNALAAPLGGATQRFVTFAIGTKDNGRIKEVFSTSVYIHIILALLTCITIEFAGEWYLNNKMNIPNGRNFAAHFILHTSVFALFSKIITIPYSAAVVAYEKFGFYAWNSIILTILRLILILFLPHFKGDKLISYGIMDMSVNILLNSLFIWYCLTNLKGCKLIKTKNRSLYKEIICFSGWNFLGTSSSIVYTQGSNILLNYFFGVLLNAAMGITQQVLNAVNSFVSNFMMAVNPQITKSYAIGNLQRTNALVFMGSKIASYLLLIVGAPIVININYILNIWLAEVPQHTDSFVILAIFSTFITSFTNPFNCLIFATGDIKSYQLLCIIVNTSSLIILYMLFNIGFHPSILYVILISQAIIKLLILIKLAKQKTKFPIFSYIKTIYLKAILFWIPIILILTLKKHYEYNVSLGIFTVESFGSVATMMILIYLFGLNKEEKKQTIKSIKQYTKKE